LLVEDHTPFHEHGIALAHLQPARVIRTGRPALVHDSALDSDHIGPSEVVLRSQLAVPLTVGGRAWGVLALESPEAGVFSADDVLLLETIAAQVGAALQRGAQLRELNETVAVLRATLARTPHP